MKSATLLLVPLVGSLVDAAGRIHGSKAFSQEPISPALNPESHKAWTQDYPKDLQPSAEDNSFKHPYPIVQDAGDYDKDYVKDENGDGGEWKAQFTYDTLRTGIGAQKEKMKKKAEEAEEAQKRLDEAKEQHAEAKVKAEKTEDEAKEAREASADADKKVKELVGDSSEADTGNSSAVGGKVGEGVDELERKVESMKDCQQELAAAKRSLAKAVEEKKKRAKAAKAAKAKAKAAGKHLKHTEQKHKDDKESSVEETQSAEEAGGEEESAELAKAEAVEDDAAAKVKALEAKLQQEEAAVAKAEEDYNTKTKEVETTEVDLKKAADRLRKFRSPEPTKPAPKSGAVTSALSGVLLSFFCAVAAMP